MLIVIKGDRASALRACLARGVTEFLSIEEHPGFAETWVKTYDHHWWQVQKWFCEAPQERAPYNPGTCLFYAHTQ